MYEKLSLKGISPRCYDVTGSEISILNRQLKQYMYNESDMKLCRVSKIIYEAFLG